MAYIGQSLTEGTRRVYNYTATASQTTFNAIYQVGVVDVYQNGSLLTPSSYTATDGATIVLDTGATAGDTIAIHCHNTFSVTDSMPASGGAFSGEVTFENGLIVDTGSVGIGTSSPSKPLHVKSSTLDAVALFESSDAKSGIELKDNSTVSPVGIFAEGDNATLYTSNTERMRIDSSGNVGIGVTSTSHKLHVKNNTSGAISSVYIENDSATSGANAELRLDAAGNNFHIRNYPDADSSNANRTDIGSTAGSSYITFSPSSSEKMRIDSSGNLLVGKTSSSFSTIGARLSSTDNQFVTDGQLAAAFNRKTSLGDVIGVFKDGSEVGTIGVEFTDNLFIGGNSSHCTLGFGSSAVYPTDGNSGGSDADTDLGSSANRFKDLYLSGGAYIGGTGSANHLDDYEEGTWTPLITGQTTAGTHSVLSSYGTYVKIGRLVYLNFGYNANSGTGSGNLLLSNIPFQASNAQHTGHGGGFQYNSGVSYPTGYYEAQWVLNTSNYTSFYLRCNSPTGGSLAYIPYPTAPSYVRGTLFYEV